MKKAEFKRILSLVLACTFVLAMVPAATLATGGSNVIGASAFEGSQISDTREILQFNITSIGADAFKDCENLKEVHFECDYSATLFAGGKDWSSVFGGSLVEKIYYSEDDTSGWAAALAGDIQNLPADVAIGTWSPKSYWKECVISIDTQPADATVTVGSISGNLTVAASGSTQLAYQWYSNTTETNVGGATVSGAVDASFPIPTDLETGTYYYFCEVSADDAKVPVRTDAVTVTVNPAPVPVIAIGTHPANATVTAGSISGNLTVAATVTQGAALSYQWFSNTSNSNVGGTAVSGATAASFAIPTNLAAGTYYYFCEVRAAGATARRSNAATVTVNVPFIPVTGITGISTAAMKPNATRTLNASVSPATATNRTVTWSIVSAGKTKATISGNKLTVAALGTVKIKATIANGKAQGVAYTQDFTINVTGYKVTFKAGTKGRGTMNAVTNRFGNYKIPKNKYTRAGYEFVGFKTGKTTYKVGSTIKITKNTTLTAQWKKVSVAKAKAPKLSNPQNGRLRITFNATSGAAGYQILMGTNSKITKGKKTFNQKGRTKTVTKLRKGTTYYVKVRAQKLDSTGKKVFGKWSAVRKLKLKK